VCTPSNKGSNQVSLSGKLTDSSPPDVQGCID
jgi:hypothetical protein